MSDLMNKYQYNRELNKHSIEQSRPYVYIRSYNGDVYINLNGEFNKCELQEIIEAYDFMLDKMYNSDRDTYRPTTEDIKNKDFSKLAFIKLSV